MAVFSDDVAHAALNAIETAIGPSPILVIFNAAQPNNTTAADVGTVLAEIQLAADFMTDAVNRTKMLQAAGQDTAANAAGVPAGFALKQGSLVKARGSCSAVGGNGEIQFANTPFVAGSPVHVTEFSIIFPG